MNDTAQQQSATYEGEEIDLLEILLVIAENLRLLVLGSLAAGLAALGISFLITPTFTAKTTFLPPQQQQSAAAAMLQSLGALSGIAGAASGIKNPADQYVALLKSNSVKGALIDRFGLIERYGVDYRDEVRQLMAEKYVRVSAARNNGMVSIEVDDHDPKFAAALANAYIEELARLLGRLAVTEAQERRAFFERELKKTRDGLATAEAALKETGINESAIKASPEAAVESVASLMAQVAAKEVQIGAMRNYLTDSAPEFRRAQSELAALRAQLARTEKGVKISDGGSDYVAKYRDFKYYETLFELMAKQYEIARIDESREGAVIQVVDTALPPERKSKPKKALITVITTLATGFFLLIFILIRQVIRCSKQNPEAAHKIDNIKSALLRAIKGKVKGVGP